MIRKDGRLAASGDRAADATHGAADASPPSGSVSTGAGELLRRASNLRCAANAVRSDEDRDFLAPKVAVTCERTAGCLEAIAAWRDQRYAMHRAERKAAVDAGDDYGQASATAAMLELLEFDSLLHAQGIEARQRQDREDGLGPKDESPVRNADAPNLNIQPSKAKESRQ